MKETMITNCVSIVAGAAAISVACKVTKSAWPLLAFVFIPTFQTTESEKEKAGVININVEKG